MKFMLDNIAKALWLSVTTNPKRLAEARCRADSEWSEYYKKVVSNLDICSSFSDDDINMLRRSSDSVELLKGYLSDAAITSTGAGAAALLCSLMVSDGRKYLVRVLGQGDSRIRIHVLKYLRNEVPFGNEAQEHDYRSFILGDSQLVTSLLEQLKDMDPEVVKEAVSTCCTLKLPGFNAFLVNLLDRTDLLNPESVLYWLSFSQKPLTTNVLRCALGLSQKKKESDACLWVFKRFAKHEDAELRRLACDELERTRHKLKLQLEQFPDNGSYFQSDRASLVEALAETSGQEDLQWLSDTFDKERGYYACILLIALVRLQGEVGRNRLLALFRDDKRRTIAIEASGKVFAGSGDGEIVQVLERISHDVDERELKEIYYALQLIGGEMAAQLLRELDVGPTINDIRTHIIASGLCDEKTFEEALKRIQSRITDEPQGPPGFYKVLNEIGILAEFDSETRHVPCQHDEVVAHFAKHSRGIFMPEAISQELNIINRKPPVFDYTLRFIHGNKLYEGSLRNFGEKGGYDESRMVDMMNQALADSDSKERFIAVDYDTYVCADPDIFVPLANELRFPIKHEAK